MNLSADQGNTAEVKVGMVQVNATQDVVVDHTPRDGRDATRDDYAVSATRTVAVTAGKSPATISVEVENDLADEADEVFVVNSESLPPRGGAESRAVLGQTPRPW